MKPVLSILICHLPERAASFADLMGCLVPQCSARQVEVIVDRRERYEVTTGEKRNSLLQKAKAPYVAFVDDDDMVPDTYVRRIVGAIRTKQPDVVGFEGVMLDKGKVVRFVHSLAYQSWFERDGILYRCPNHLNPMRRDIALSVGFPDMTVGEDMAFSLRLIGKLNSEFFIPRPPMYIYQPAPKVADLERGVK